MSLITGSVSFSHFTRETLDFIPRHEMTKFDENSTWYFAPQAVFKYHITFDKILGKIQAEDPNAVIILMQLVDPTLEALHVKVVERLQKQGGVDLDRVVFVPRMRHNELMAMNKLTDAVLDSVFGGRYHDARGVRGRSARRDLAWENDRTKVDTGVLRRHGNQRLHREERRRVRQNRRPRGKREFQAKGENQNAHQSCRTQQII